MPAFSPLKKAGIDTVYRIGDEILHNPDPQGSGFNPARHCIKTEPDSIYTFAITNDSAYVFAITNYQSGLKETKIAGDAGSGE